jgi:hypothetical protein
MKELTKEKSIADIAKEIYYSIDNNGYGVRCGAITDAMHKYGVEFKPIFDEIVLLGELEQENR